MISGGVNAQIWLVKNKMFWFLLAFSAAKKTLYSYAFPISSGNIRIQKLEILAGK